VSVFRDKFPMSLKAKAGGITVPDFVPLLNRDEIADFMVRVPPPWIVKPRSDASAIGIRKVEKPEVVWSVIEELDARERLSERSSYYLLAQFIPGEVFHVDSTVQNGRVMFAGANRTAPLQVAHGGGAYISHTVQGSSDQKNCSRSIDD
jgi:glutathione synthase/RimK-type ligase-like ATP-grasp enzyme